MATVKLSAPVGYAGTTINGGVTAASYTIASDRSVTVDSRDSIALLSLGFQTFNSATQKVFFSSPLPADLVSIVAAATPAANTTPLTIAAQPAHARKLQYRIVIGTTTTTKITAGNVVVVGVDQDGNALSETVSLVANASKTITSAYAWAQITSLTPDGTYAANGSGTGNTFGIGVSNDFGLPSYGAGSTATLTMIKATKITWGGSNATKVAADDVASTGTLDAVARTFASTTAPAASGAVDYEFSYSFTGN